MPELVTAPVVEGGAMMNSTFCDVGIPVAMIPVFQARPFIVSIIILVAHTVARQMVTRAPALIVTPVFKAAGIYLDKQPQHYTRR